MAGKVYSSDFLVIGSGLSGQLFSIKVAKHGTVNMVTKGDLTESATLKAQGGIAAAVSPDDSTDLHVEDTIRVGAGLCHRDVVENIVKDGPERIQELVEIGVDFCDEDELGLEGGHSKRRVLHVKDHTGEDIELALTKRLKGESNIKVFENHMAVNLYVKNNRVYGAYILDLNTNEIERF
ncbi:MAG: FAD-binding protein, partial [Candidatus Thorarchaeota archaeon]